MAEKGDQEAPIRRLPPREILDERALDQLEELLNQFHRVIRRQPCKDTYMEELVWYALEEAYPEVLVDWEPGSHRKLSDIEIRAKPSGPPIELLPISVKSGIWDKQQRQLTLSGPRLQAALGEKGSVQEMWSRGAARLIKHLNAEDTRCAILAASKPDLKNFEVKKEYSICYVDPSFFKYPPPEAWTSQGNKFVATLASGITAELRPSMSWQLWWLVPGRLVHVLRTMHIK